MQFLNSKLFRLAHELEIRTRKRMAGNNKGDSFLYGKGRGMEFRDVRPYLSGDDIRMIDWNVTSRTGDLHVKEFFLEKDLPIIIFIDLSYSMLSWKKKSETGFQLAIFLAYVHFLSGNKAQFLCYSNKLDLVFEPIRSIQDLWKLTKKLQVVYSLSENENKKTDHSVPYKYLQERVYLRSLVYWISDFAIFDCKDVRSIHKKHEMHACLIDSDIQAFTNSGLDEYFYSFPSEGMKFGKKYLSRIKEDSINLRNVFHKNIVQFKPETELSKQILKAYGAGL